MKAISFLILLLLTTLSVKAQNFSSVCQPVVCSLNASIEQGAVLVLPEAVYLDEERTIRFGYVVLWPEGVSTSIHALEISDTQPSYHWEGDKLIFADLPNGAVISVYSLDGRLLHKDTGVTEFNLTGLSGVLVVQVLSSANIQSFKVVH